MKITNLQNGNIIIEFTKNEIEIINDKKPVQSQIDVFKGMRRHTKAFAKELHFYFSNNEFDIKHEKVVELRKKYFIVDTIPAIQSLINNEAIKVTYKYNIDGSRRIDKLKFDI